LRVTMVDEDNSEGSRAFIDRLSASGEFTIDRASRGEAEALVRRAQRAAYVVIKPGFGEGSQKMFSGPQRAIEIGNDPARVAEAVMIEGFLTKHAMADMRKFLPRSVADWQPLIIAKAAVARDRVGPANGFEITFPQGVMWGIIGCIMTFAIGLVSERVHGTFVRLQMAPLTRGQILAGKALACFVAISLVQVMLFTLGITVFGIRPSSIPLLMLACICASAGFVGFMMMIAGLGRTEQSAAGAGWAMLMPMTMFGGGMMPQFIMPTWMQTAGNLSPVKWAILAMEGAVWRNFSLAEMAMPCAILLAFGAVCFAIGVRGLRDA